MHISLKCLFLLSIGLFACSPDNGQVGEETLTCRVISTQNISLEENTSANFSAMDILLFSEGSHQAELQWADSSTSTLTLNLDSVGGPTLLTREWLDEDGNTSPFENLANCPTQIEIIMMATLQTEDGALDESWTVRLLAEDASEARFSRTLTTINGSLNIASYAPEGDYNNHQAFLSLRLHPDGMDGAIDGQAESNIDPLIASAVNYPIASFTNE